MTGLPDRPIHHKEGEAALPESLIERYVQRTTGRIDHPTAERWFNTEAFERDWNVRTFPLRLSNVRADGFNQWDMSLIKSFRITERLRFQLRAEAQNAMNHAMFVAPNTAPANSLFGQVNAAQFPEQRRITIAGKLSF